MIISVDIGSTFTKGAAFADEGDDLRLLAQASTATTTNNLVVGFQRVVDDLRRATAPSPATPNVIFSSSAKGGLRVAAIGVVPNLTVKMAREAACSAGARLVAAFSHKLSKHDVRRLEDSNPDIVLFTGGTDGGNETINLHNAEKLARSELNAVIIYAGNADVADDVAEILAEKQMRVTENALPELDAPNPEPAREAIREVFLDSIVQGKGLDAVVTAAGGAEPAPTPYVMLEYVKAFAESTDGLRDFCLIDLGGATTDFYSCHDDSATPGDVVHRGLREPMTKRTVEGDLGMRVGAATAREAATAEIQGQLAKAGVTLEEFDDYLSSLTANPEHLAQTPAETIFDDALAAGCVRVAEIRHVGRLARFHTVNGEIHVRTGKDLRGVNTVIGAGGYLAKSDLDLATLLTKPTIDDRERLALTPEHLEVLIDRNHLFPLLANAARENRAAAVRLGIKELRRFPTEL